ncbi:MAG: hypothetical protein A2X59_04490 [Nitrospirae bacterium GWC2_42_7]|nr:MAG: hypothetical protein A2X59_04490 [Nitrospirae bacterium GWC2_42_7]
MKRIALMILSFFVMISFAYGEDDPLTKLKDDTMLYFAPLNGTITAVDGDKVVMKIDSKSPLKPGTRVKLLREGIPFIHPITKEILGKVESTVGKVEIKEVRPESSTGIVVEGEAKEGDKVRISETKIKLVFCQDQNVDWHLADEYYRKLKATEKIEMTDTALETSDEKKLLDEAKKLGSEVALLLTTKSTDDKTLMRQQAFWVSDGSKFIDTEITIDVAFVKELKFGDELFSPHSGEAILAYNLPFKANLIAAGDIDGDRKQEIIVSTGNEIMIYMPAVDLQFLKDIKGFTRNEFLWLDTIDLNKNGRDEIVITTMKDSDIVSYIYELSGPEFRKLWEGNYFLHRVNDSLFAQAYSPYEGFKGDVLNMIWDGEYKTGETVKVPKGVNVYDFTFVAGIAEGDSLFTYDELGYLNLYNEKKLRTWRSTRNTGEFPMTFKLKSTVSYLDKGVWSIKDRLISSHKEVLAVERVPFSNMAKGIGNKSSLIKSYWWNGFSMEESVLINKINGGVLDYALAGDNIIVLASPFMGVNFGKILKGKNPLGTALYIYAVKGR